MALSLSLSRRNIPVETQDLAENQDQDHSDEDSRLLHESPDAHVADNTDAVACCKTCHSHRKTATEMHETTMVGVSNVYVLRFILRSILRQHNEQGMGGKGMSYLNKL